MLYRFFFFCLVLWIPCANIPQLFAHSAYSIEEPWLGCSPTERFVPLLQLSAQAFYGYEEQLVPYFKARGVDKEEAIDTFFRADLFAIAHALSLLFAHDSLTVLESVLGEHYSLIAQYNAQIDHVGRELFGPISFYLPVLEEIAPQLGLIIVRHLVFPSTQVVKVLQAHDPNITGVTIGRVYFQNTEDGNIRCIELFQASPLEGTSPQPIQATQERLSLLTLSKENCLMTPIDHIAIEFATVEEVKSIHCSIHQRSSDTLMPYQREVSHNAGDGSIQTKALIRDFAEAQFNKIVEFVHYSTPTSEKQGK